MNCKEDISHERIIKIKKLLHRLDISSKESIYLEEKSTLLIINEALTHTSAKQSTNHERLEFLGDAVLRLAATEFIENNYKNLNVGERSALRSQIVSDEWLTRVGQKINIQEALVLGTKAAKDKSAISTIEAETTEALIGALYEPIRDLNIIKLWLEKYWHESCIKIIDDPYKNNYKSALQEWCQSKGLKIPNYVTKEVNKTHGDMKRFFCKVRIDGKDCGQGWGGSIKQAEKEAAEKALKKFPKNKVYKNKI
tara:strand:- start:56 stop:814 length:759 start_codon:yes stop_codon:yes gene_type:complete